MDISDWIALSSAVIALLALGISIYVARKQRKLSVLPLLHVDMDEREGSDIEISIVNRGVGPAIIKSFAIFCDDKKYTFPAKKEYAEILTCLGLNLDDNDFSASIPTRENALSPGSTFSVMRFNGTSENRGLHKNVRQVLPRIKIKIEYESICKENRFLRYPDDA